MYRHQTLDPMPRDRQQSPSAARFRLFPQPPVIRKFLEPEVVFVPIPPSEIREGPESERMYVVEPVGKKQPYGIDIASGDAVESTLPPWRGKRLPPALPDREGNFDYLKPGDPGFEAAHAFGSAHFVLSIWERYFGGVIPWHFADHFEKLEISLLPSLDNAHIGYGFMEIGGEGVDRQGWQSFALNFDIVAHEMGHAIIYSVVGMPDEWSHSEYFGFHESAADLVALISSLHFDSVVDEVLESSRGNLYTANLLNRMGELSSSSQIRTAANTLRMRDFTDGWSDEHKLAQPLTGALFDIFVDIFHEELLERQVLDPAVEDLSDKLLYRPDYSLVMQAFFDQSYYADPNGFKSALIDARDTLAILLGETWSRLHADDLSYKRVMESFLLADRIHTGGVYQRLIYGNFIMRDIGELQAGPRLKAPDENSHAFSVRTMIV